MSYTVWNILISFRDKSLFTLSWPWMTAFLWLLSTLKAFYSLNYFKYQLSCVASLGSGTEASRLFRSFANRSDPELCWVPEIQGKTFTNIDNNINNVEGNSSHWGLQMPFRASTALPANVSVISITYERQQDCFAEFDINVNATSMRDNCSTCSNNSVAWNVCGVFGLFICFIFNYYSAVSQLLRWKNALKIQVTSVHRRCDVKEVEHPHMLARVAHS